MHCRASAFALLLLAATLSLLAQTKEPAQTNKVAAAPPLPVLKVTSAAFQHGDWMPVPHTCHGVNTSPILSWEGAPPETESFVVICEDIDTKIKPFCHWAIFNIPKDSKGLPEKVPALKQLANGTQQGFNDFRKLGYNGPCPPGGTHRYYFKVYALNNTLLILGDVNREKLLEAMKGRVIAQGEIMAKYGH